MPIVQKKKLRYRKVKKLTQAHTGSSEDLGLWTWVGFGSIFKTGLTQWERTSGPLMQCFGFCSLHPSPYPYVSISVSVFLLGPTCNAFQYRSPLEVGWAIGNGSKIDPWAAACISSKCSQCCHPVVMSVKNVFPCCLRDLEWKRLDGWFLSRPGLGLSLSAWWANLS